MSTINQFSVLDKICVPVQYLKACEEMLEVPTKSKAILECVAARDRYLNIQRYLKVINKLIFYGILPFNAINNKF